MQTKELGRLQYLAGIIEDQTAYIPKVKLTESELAEFERLWENTINQEAFQKLDEMDKASVIKVLNVIKDITLAIWSPIAKFGEFVFQNLNRIIWFLIRKVIFRPFSYLLVAVGLGWQVISNLLDFNIWGTEINPGQAMDEGVLRLFEKSYDDIVSGLQNVITDPNSYTTPIDLITEFLAGILITAKVTVPAVLSNTVGILQWLIDTVGIEPIGATISWIYLIGGGQFFYKKAQKFLAPTLKSKVVKAVETEVNKLPPEVKDKAENEIAKLSHLDNEDPSGVS